MAKKEIDYLEKLRKFARSGIDNSPPPNRSSTGIDDIDTLDVRINKLLGIINNKERKDTNMMFFVMYDIESNKVRRYVMKYLLKQGCFRIQRSIFLADLPPETYNEIKNDLVEVQAAYDNKDSILVVPISTEYLNAMRIIGQDIGIDVIMRTRTTLFF